MDSLAWNGIAHGSAVMQSDEDEGSLPQGSANRGDPGKSKDQRMPSRLPPEIPR